MMKVIHIQKYGRMPQLATCPIPPRGLGQLLIKMKYAPINPSDLNFYLGSYGIRKQGFPIMGFEGSGVIEESDRGAFNGKRVSILSNSLNGTYAQYIVSNPHEIILWPDSSTASYEELSMCSINPLSVLGMCDIINQQQFKNIVLSAASSNVNKMMVNFIVKNMKNKIIYGLSRSDKYDGELKVMGYNQLYRMDEVEKLKHDLKDQEKAVFFDCVGGKFAGTVFNSLPPDSLMVNYGRLSKQNLGQINLSELYFKNKQIQGFWLNTYLKSMTLQKSMELKSSLIENSQIFKQNVRKIFPLEHFEEAARESIINQSQGKILLNLQ